MRIDQLHPRPTNAQPLVIPPELLDSVNRHQANLAALVASLRGAGLPESMVETSIRSLVDSYAQELTSAIHAMTKASLHD